MWLAVALLADASHTSQGVGRQPTGSTVVAIFVAMAKRTELTLASTTRSSTVGRRDMGGPGSNRLALEQNVAIGSASAKDPHLLLYIIADEAYV